MLMPNASQAPFRTTNQISDQDFKHFQEQPYLIASIYSKFLKVQTIYVNAVGTYPDFMGGSLVVDEKESKIEQLGNRGELRIVEITTHDK